MRTLAIMLMLVAAVALPSMAVEYTDPAPMDTSATEVAPAPDEAAPPADVIEAAPAPDATEATEEAAPAPDETSPPADVMEAAPAPDETSAPAEAIEEAAPVPDQAPPADAMEPAPMLTPTEKPATTSMTTMAPESENFNRQFAKQYFGLSDSEVQSLRTGGMTWGDIYTAANLANRSGRSVTEVASWRNQGLSWTEIGSRYNVAAADISTPFMVRRGSVAGVTEQVMGGRPAPILNKSGSVILTETDAYYLRRQGYSWQDIAVAANIARHTGKPVSDILKMTWRGLT